MWQKPSALAAATMAALLLTSCGGEETAPVPTVPQAMAKIPLKPATPELGDPCTPLRQAGVASCEVKKVASSKPKDALVAQEPAAGTPVAAAGKTTLTYSLGPEEATIPAVEGKQPGDVENVLYGLGLVVKGREEVDVPHVAQGRVVSLKGAKEGDVVPRGTEVFLVVSSGFMEVPDFTGLTLQEAQKTATAAKMKVVPRYLKNPNQKPDLVYLQNPSPGRVPRQERVEITLSQKPEESGATVPEVQGMPLSEAILSLRNAGFRNVRTVKDKEFPRYEDEEAKVLSLTPEMGMRVPNTTEVVLTIEGDPEVEEKN